MVDQTCHDVRASLMACSGMAAVFGVVAIALKIAGGVDPVADMQVLSTCCRLGAHNIPQILINHSLFYSQGWRSHQ